MAVDLLAAPFSRLIFPEKPDLVRRDQPTAMLASFLFKEAGTVKENHADECKCLTFNTNIL